MQSALCPLTVFVLEPTIIHHRVETSTPGMWFWDKYNLGSKDSDAVRSEQPLCADNSYEGSHVAYLTMTISELVSQKWNKKWSTNYA